MKSSAPADLRRKGFSLVSLASLYGATVFGGTSGLGYQRFWWHSPVVILPLSSLIPRYPLTDDALNFRVTLLPRELGKL